jgi:hypothetical protein
MTDLNVMMREHARTGLQTQLDAAVTNGDTEAARKITADMEKLAVSTAPKAPPYGDTEIKAQLEKAEWFGTDPKKSAKAIEFGKTMDPKKFATAEAFAAALIKSVEEEFPAAKTTPKDGDEEDEPGDEEDEPGDGAGAEKPAKPKPRRTDAPGDADTVGRSARRTGPWTKLADAPSDIQKEIKRSADKFISSTATKEQREGFINKALESHYAAHQRKTGKK